MLLLQPLQQLIQGAAAYLANQQGVNLPPLHTSSILLWPSLSYLEKDIAKLKNDQDQLPQEPGAEQAEIAEVLLLYCACAAKENRDAQRPGGPARRGIPAA